MFPTQAFVLIFVLAQLGSISPARADIVGGDDVGEVDPIRASTVGLYTPAPDGRGGSLCTASIIGKDMAVTAAHCIAPGGRKPVMLFGRDLHAAGVVARPVVGARVNPGWKRHRGRGMDQGDIALVRFGNGLPPGYHAVGVARSDRALEKGTPIVLAGYGISDAPAKAGSGRLRKTRVSVWDSRKGKPEMVFDQSHGHGACHGDSGGPAFTQRRGRPVLAGVTNRSYPETAPDDCAHKVVYTKVSAYRDWIRKSESELRKNRPHAARAGRLSGHVGKNERRGRSPARSSKRRRGF